MPKDGSSSGDDDESEGLLKTKCKKIPTRVEWESSWLNITLICIFLFYFGTYEAEEEEEEDDLDGDKDAVFVTDGDSDLGQVCVFRLSQNHHTLEVKK